MTACPYYKQGYCTSPLLERPDDSVTSAIRCLRDYKTCRLYKEPEPEQELEPKSKIKIGLYYNTNLLHDPMESECEFYQLIKLEDKGYLVKCVVQDRLLTRLIVTNCVKHHTSCPYRDIGFKIISRNVEYRGVRK